MKNYNKIIILIIISSVFALILSSLNKDDININFFKVNRKASVLVSGSNKEPEIEKSKKMSSFTIFGPYNNSFEVNFDGLENDAAGKKVAVVNELSGLKPNSEYIGKLKLNLSVEEYKNKFVNVGFVNYVPEEFYDKENKKFTTNISTLKKEEFRTFKILNGLNKMEVELKFKTNEEGNVWVVSSFESGIDSKFKFSIGQINISLKEIKNDN
jgi:hypothetical protein